MHTSRQGEISPIHDGSDLHQIFQSGDVDFVFLHYQLDNFEHYDTVSFKDASWTVSPDCHRRITEQLQQSLLAAAIVDTDVVSLRTILLRKLGYGPDSSDFSASSSSSSASAMEQDDDLSSNNSGCEEHGQEEPHGTVSSSDVIAGKVPGDQALIDNVFQSCLLYTSPSPRD